MKNKKQLPIEQPLLLAALLSALFLLPNCGGIINTLERYSGETLYESAIQQPGDILGFVPDIQSDIYEHLDTKKEIRKFQVFQIDFLTQLVKDNPGFAKEFYDKMHSGDREKINEALEEAGELVEEELQDFTGESDFTAGDVVDAVMEKYKD